MRTELFITRRKFYLIRMVVRMVAITDRKGRHSNKPCKQFEKSCTWLSNHIDPVTKRFYILQAQ